MISTEEKDIIINFTQEELKEIRDIIWKQTGIYIEDNKLYLLNYKVGSRLKKLDIKPREYVRLLNDSVSEEIKEIINSITIGETQFFRDKIQLDIFFDKIFREYLKDYKGEEISFLSAGCSTGEEPYTIAIYLLEKFPLINFKVVGVDINENFISKAKEGIYGIYSVRSTPPYIFTKYFERLDDSTWKIKEDVKKKVQLERVNLMDRVRVKLLGKFDVIFCKNVIIYFDDSSRNKLAETFWSILKKGGFLVLGPAERISIISLIFEPLFDSGMFFYKKVEKSGEFL
ncbi:Chemotaxis protein methyltransferase Cher2 [bacterium HR19]|nr:Chemotaxis protein methyltransferase Cher2 [bacterium HR19]